MDTPNTNKHLPSKPSKKQTNQAGLIDRLIKSVVGGLLGLLLAGLFGMVVLAFIVKAFMSPDNISYQLLNTAVTTVSALLGAVIGYLFGKNSSR